MPSWRNCVPNRRNFDDHHPEIESPYCPAIDWWDRHGPTHLVSLKHVEIISCQPQTNKPRGTQEKWYHLPQKMGPTQLGYLWILDWHCIQGNWWWIPQREVAEGGIQKSLFQCPQTQDPGKGWKRDKLSFTNSSISPSPPQMKDSNVYLRWWPFLQPGAALVYPETTGPGGPRWWVIKDDRQYRLFARQPSWIILKYTVY